MYSLHEKEQKPQSSRDSVVPPRRHSPISLPSHEARDLDIPVCQDSNSQSSALLPQPPWHPAESVQRKMIKSIAGIWIPCDGYAQRVGLLGMGSKTPRRQRSAPSQQTRQEYALGALHAHHSASLAPQTARDLSSVQRGGMPAASGSWQCAYVCHGACIGVTSPAPASSLDRGAVFS